MIAFCLRTPTAEKRKTSWGLSKRKRPNEERDDIKVTWKLGVN